jgi:hypothetical protein
MPVGFMYSIHSPPTPDHPDGETIYIGSSQSTETVRFSTWRTQAKFDYLSTPLLRHAHNEWGGLDTCMFRVLARLELPDDAAAAKTALRDIEDGYTSRAQRHGVNRCWGCAQSVRCNRVAWYAYPQQVRATSISISPLIVPENLEKTHITVEARVWSFASFCLSGKRSCPSF